MGKVKNLESLIKKPFIIWEVIDEKKGTITFSNFFINRDDFLYKDKTSFTSKYYSNLYWELFERALINYSNSKATSNSMEELCEKALLEN